MKAVIEWGGKAGVDGRKFHEGNRGRLIIECAELGDPRIAKALDSLALNGARNVSLTFDGVSRKCSGAEHGQ